MAQIQDPVVVEEEYEVLPEHKPNPKVAVVIAGAALAVTFGLTLLILPHARAAAKAKVPTQFIAQRYASRPLRAPAQQPSEAAPHPDLVKAREFNDHEETRRFGRVVENEDGDDVFEPPLEPVSPWLGFQALAIATGIVGTSVGLGVYAAAKYLEVTSMDDFVKKMRGTLDTTMPMLVERVRRVADDEHEMGKANVLNRYGHLDDEKLQNWLRKFEPVQEGEVVEGEVVEVEEAVVTAPAVVVAVEEPKRLV